MAATTGAVQLGSMRHDKPLPADAPFYRKLWHGWQRVARAFGNLLSRTVTSLVFFLVVPVFALGVKLSADPLRLKPGPVTWTPVPPAPGLEDARRGF